MFYALLKLYCRITLKFYFSKWQAHGAENIPEGQVLFVPNHQNAFLDAVLVACSSKKNPWFITRSDVFKSDFAKWILGKLQMLPVYRFRDGYSTLKNNDQVLKNCAAKIDSGETLLIFAEGNHADKFQLRPLQKGAARMAYATNPEYNLPVVPVGIQYEFENGFRSRVLVSFGKPIYTKPIRDESMGSEKRFHDRLLDSIRTNLSPLILDIEDMHYEETVTYLKSHRKKYSDLTEQLRHDQKLIAEFKPGITASVPGKGKSIVRKLTDLNLFVPSFIIKQFITKNIKDPQFKNPVIYAAGMILVPIVLPVQAMALGLLTGSVIVAWVYLLAILLLVKVS